MKASVLSFLFSLCFCIVVLSKIKVNTKTHLMVDEFDRVRFYHGVNAVYKKFPFVPISTHFDKDYSLSDEDFANLKKWGLTFVRLHMPWEGVEAVRGQYNFALLNEIKTIVQKAQKYGITILLDVHQDLLSKKFCGEGFPEWAVQRNKSFPNPVRSSIKRDERGYPLIDDCLSLTFAKYYFSYDIGESFRDLFTNYDNIADSFGAFWKTVATEFKNEPNIIGYEILNEPFFADIYNNPEEAINPGYEDFHYLQPFYRKINEYIRAVDQETIVFFENIVMGESVGFTEGPGGVAYNDRQIFSYHVYCGFDPSNFFIRYVCQLSDWVQYNGKLSAAKAIGIGSFLTEFGALYNTKNEVNEIGNVARKAENLFQSWAYWQFKNFGDTTTTGKGYEEGFYLGDGSLQENKVAALAVTYMYALCGEPISNDFDRSNGVYKIVFTPRICKNGKNSEIYISEDYYYSKTGFKFTFAGCGTQNCYLKNLESRYYYEVVVPATVTGQISLEISPK